MSNQELSLARTKWANAYSCSRYLKVRDLFDNWAEGRLPNCDRYDRDVAYNYYGPSTVASKAIPHLPEQAKILDLGCGTGLSGEVFVRAGFEVHGIDISSRMLRKAEERGYAELHVADLVNDGLPSVCLGKFDSLISVGVLGEWIMPSAVMPNIFQFLKREAVIGFAIEHEHAEWDWLLDMLEKENFQLLDVALRAPGWGNIEQYNYLVAKREE